MAVVSFPRGEPVHDEDPSADPHAGAPDIPPDHSGSDEASGNAPSDIWMRGLLYGPREKDGSSGKPKRGLANTLHVLSLHPAWRDVIAYDAFGECVVKLKAPPVRKQDQVAANASGEWAEADSARTAAWFATEVGFEPTTVMVDTAVCTTAERRRIHPVRDWLAGLTWDGAARLDRMFATYFGAADTPYTRAISAMWMISAVARVMEPGCQADCMPVLEGPQGLGKSTGIEALFGKALFADTGIHIGEKDSYQSLRRKWGYEFGELSSLKGREVERVKAFVSARVDNYRPSYGRRNKDFPRQCVFAGTTNDTEYLADRTGNRRFWPVRCGARVDVDGIRRDREQLWAEAFVRYRAGEKWHVNTPELRALCEQEQKERETIDPWNELVSRWLENPTVPVRDSKTERSRLDLAAGITTADVLIGALDFRRPEIQPAATARVGHVLRALGWAPRQKREHGERVRRYFDAASQGEQDDGSEACDTKEAESPPQPTSSHPSHADPRAHVETGFGGISDPQTKTPVPACDAVTPDGAGGSAAVIPELGGTP